jgi:hypothetical protein
MTQAAAQTSENNGVASVSERTASPEGQPVRAGMDAQTPVASASNGEMPSPNAPAPKPANRVEQAEILADQLATRVAVVTSLVGRGLFRFFARAREEAEDVWAEAQHIRRSGRQK